MSVSNTGTYHFGEFELNLSLRVLVRDGQRVSIGPKAYDVLTCLVMHAGEVVSKADLMKQVWPESFVEEGTLTQHVFSLRKALGDKADWVVTVPGYGYRFAEKVQRVSAEAPRAWQPLPGEDVVLEVRERTRMIFEEPLPMQVTKPASSRVRTAALAGGVVIALGILAGWKLTHRVVPHDSIGVIVADFANTTNDPAFDHTLKRALEIDLDSRPTSMSWEGSRPHRRWG